MSYINKIGLEPMKEFVEKAIATYAGGEITDKAEKVAEVTYAMLEDKGLVQEHGNQTFVDCLIAASLIHDVFHDDVDWTYVFDARLLLTKIGDEVGLPTHVQDGIYEAIEAQLGNQTPVIKCRPLPGTPQETFASAVWFVNKFMN